VPDPIRYAILDHASEDSPIWELAWSLNQIVGGRTVELHPRLPVKDVQPHLLDLLRERHVEVYPLEDPSGPSLSLEDALVVASDEANWDAATAKTRYGVVLTESGEREYRAEYEAARRG